MMFHSPHIRQIRIIGVALSGSDGLPVVVFESQDDGTFLTLSVSPFDAEAVIREYTGEGDDTAAAWLADILRKNPPRKGRVERSEDNSVRIRFFGTNRRSDGDRTPTFGDGFTLVNRLNLPLFAHKRLFHDCRNELAWLIKEKSFVRDFLYLTPTEYTPNIPVV